MWGDNKNFAFEIIQEAEKQDESDIVIDLDEWVDSGESLDSSFEWKISDLTKITHLIKFQDDMRMESDDENFQNTKIPSYILNNIILTSKIHNFFI